MLVRYLNRYYQAHAYGSQVFLYSFGRPAFILTAAQGAAAVLAAGDELARCQKEGA